MEFRIFPNFIFLSNHSFFKGIVIQIKKVQVGLKLIIQILYFCHNIPFKRIVIQIKKLQVGDSFNKKWILKVLYYLWFWNHPFTKNLLLWNRRDHKKMVIVLIPNIFWMLLIFKIQIGGIFFIKSCQKFTLGYFIKCIVYTNLSHPLIPL